MSILHNVLFGAKGSGASPVILPVANFTADATAITQSDSVNFTDTSTVAPGGQAITSWTWSFAGGTPTSSNAQNPSVTYNETGSFDVSLTVANPSGSDTKSVSNYIYVTASSAAAFSATGGTETTVGAYTVHTFTTSGNFIVTGSRELEIFLVGRGGTGGTGNPSNAGAGADGGAVLESSMSFSTNVYGIRVGGAGSLYGTTENYSAIQLAVDNILEQALQGANGGTGVSSGAGANGTGGVTNDWRGSSQGYGGGGGGGAGTAGASPGYGVNGGGNGGYNIFPTNYAATGGASNTGGGGGGGYKYNPTAGGAGGTGIVIIRYLTNP